VTYTAAKEVILSAGTFNSPHILMLSGIGPKDHLEAHNIPVKIPLEGVGHNLKDQVGIGGFYPVVGYTPESPYLFPSPVFNIFGPEKEGIPTYQFLMAGGFIFIAPQHQNSVGRVYLQSNNTQDPIVIDPQYLSTKEDMTTLVKGFTDYVFPLYDDLIAKGVVSPGTFQHSK
jgi:choline dehydrogenase